MTTEAGKRLLALSGDWLEVPLETAQKAIAAIEAEARAALLAELEAGVEALPCAHGCREPHGPSRAAVLDLIRKAGEK